MKHLEIEQFPDDLRAKLARCRELLREAGSAVVAFSAGVDSTFLLAIAVEVLGEKNVIAAMATSEVYTQADRAAGQEIARQLGVEFAEISVDHLSCGEFTSNPPDRCYHCKVGLLECMQALADARGFAIVLTGSNFDDTDDYRPGLQAEKEMGARRPLLEAGMTKDDIRTASRAMNLPTADKPAMACLASRIPYGTKITAGLLNQVEQAEEFLRELGFSQYRARNHGSIVRLELPQDEFQLAIDNRQAIIAKMKQLKFTFVTIDLDGFKSGSMNTGIGGVV